MNGDRELIAKRLTDLVNHPDVTIRADELWMPNGIPIQNPSGDWNLKQQLAESLTYFAGERRRVHVRVVRNTRDKAGNSAAW